MAKIKTMKKIVLIALLMGASVNMIMAQHQHHEGCIHSKGYAAMDSEGKMIPYTFERKPVGENDILIEILYCGICHSDIHYVFNHWERSVYPCLPGHEIIGKVTQTGKNVSKFKVGENVGVGCMVNACGECDMCKAGQEQFCQNGKTVYTYNSADWEDNGKNTLGGYSDNIVVNEDFVIRIPENAPLEKIAPILCAGITTYNPLKAAGVKSGDKVAIAGFGGLGHMAVQYAISFGAEVVVFDRTEDKRELASQLGAVKYVNINNAEDIASIPNNYFDVILSTIGSHYDLSLYLNKLKIGGDFAIVGIPANWDAPTININTLPYNKRVWRSLIGGIPETQEVIDYSVEHGIYPMVEIIAVDKVNEAFKNVIDGEIHFRYVMDMKTLK
jgi:uncharacterized zinc-type alcohol dehydrogenase-like protein